MKTVRLAMMLVALVGGAQPVRAQDTGRIARPVIRGRGERLAAPARPMMGRKAGAGAQVEQLDPAQRQAAIKLLRQTMNRRYRVALGLNNDQMRTLNQTEGRYERQRGELLKSERDARQGIRAAMGDSVASKDQTKIAGYLDQLTQAQRSRADLLEAEQKELSTFLNPLQRAQYLGLKEQLDRRIVQLRQQNLAAPAVKPDSIPPER
ncbi:MAG: hypothetical protein ABI442_10600 [Gemmatimonadaceae bacterium]